MKNIILFGGGNHSYYCIDAIEQEGKYKIIGIIDSIHEVGIEILGYKVIGRLKDLAGILNENKIFGGFISIGDNYIRRKVYEDVIRITKGFNFINAIHPTSIICKNVQIGVGILLMAGSILGTSSSVENFTWLGSNAILEHGSVMREFSSLSSGSMTGGKVEIGRYSAITLGVTIIDRIKIGENSVVGSGSLVLQDLPDNILAYGSPAKIIRNRKPGEKFLN